MMLKITKFTNADGSTKWHVMGDADEPVLICDTEEAAKAYVAAHQAKTDGTTRVYRVDVSPAGGIRKPVKMANGYLKVDGHLTRTGVFMYRNQDGTPRRELRLAEDVFHPDSLESFAMAPVTDDHPPKFLDATNTGSYQRGHIGESVVRDGKLMRATMLITDAGLVAKIEKGKAVEISNGYTCDLEEKSGTTDAGEKYDCIQRNIVANHVAIVPVGRAGPEARVRMDSGADVLLSISGDDSKQQPPPPPAPPEKQPVNKITIAGVEYEAGSAQAAAAQANLQTKLDTEQKARADADAKRDAEFKQLKETAEKNQARADAADEQAKKTAAELKAAPAKIAAELKARMALEDSAIRILGSKAKIDALDDKSIKILVLKQTNPDLKVDGKSDAYLDARFDHAVELFDAEEGDESEEDGVTAARRGVRAEDSDESDPGDPADDMTVEEANAKHTDAATAFEAMCVRGRNQWREPIGNEKAPE